MRKTKFLLDAVQKSGKKITYYAVDLAEKSLRDSLEPLTKTYENINFVGLWGTYHDSLKWIDSNVPKSSRKMFLWLGSSIGNLTRSEAGDFLNTVRQDAMNEGDLFLCGIDKRNDFEKISFAYNDRSGLTRDFSLNGLTHANTIFGKNVFTVPNFEFVSIYNEIDGRHEAYFESLVQQTVVFNETNQVRLEKGELINFEYSYKYSADEVMGLVKDSKLAHLGNWTDSKNLYDLHL